MKEENENLRGIQKRIFDAVKRASPNCLSTLDLVGIVYQDRADGGPEWADSVIRRSVHEVNKKLKPDGLKVSARTGRASNGYRIVKLNETTRHKTSIAGWSEGLM